MYAINYYLSNGQNITHTCNDLGYPCRTVLLRWISEKLPDHPKHKLKDKPLLKYSYNDKIVGALKLSTRTDIIIFQIVTHHFSHCCFLWAVFSSCHKNNLQTE